jgi:hypothetical protein
MSDIETEFHPLPALPDYPRDALAISVARSIVGWPNHQMHGAGVNLARLVLSAGEEYSLAKAVIDAAHADLKSLPFAVLRCATHLEHAMSALVRAFRHAALLAKLSGHSPFSPKNTNFWSQAIDFRDLIEHLDARLEGTNLRAGRIPVQRDQILVPVVKQGFIQLGSLKVKIADLAAGIADLATYASTSVDSAGK